MSKKILLLVLCFIMILPMAFSQGAEDGADDAVTLQWQVWITPNLTLEFFREIAGAFEAENPGVTVEIVEASATTSSSSADFIRNRLASGDVPDLWMNFQDIPQFADAGHLWAIPADDPDIQVVNNLMAQAYKGKLYSFASSSQPQGLMYYNKKLWAQSGLTDADIPYSWDDLLAVSAVTIQLNPEKGA